MTDTPMLAQFVLYGDDNYDSHVLRFLLAEKRISYDFHFINDRPDELAELNPYKTLPILVNREISLYELNVIFEYLEERHPAVKLLPSTPKERAQMRLLAWRIQKDWLSLAKQLLTHPDSFDVISANNAKKSLTDTLLTLSPLFTKQTFFLSETLGWCDILLAPMLHRLDTMQIALPKHLSRGIQEYYQNILTRKSFQASINPPVSHTEDLDDTHDVMDFSKFSL
ncbi:MAG: glutathione S-transferase N-terminal domain-containing protein [Moraxella sp.]|nr:glutathione S-transferase N-terminal domain-containing protein [Moraxella sp.]